MGSISLKKAKPTVPVTTAMLHLRVHAVSKLHTAYELFNLVHDAAVHIVIANKVITVIRCPCGVEHAFTPHSTKVPSCISVEHAVADC